MAIVLPPLPEKYQFKLLKDVLHPKILNCVNLDEKYFRNASISHGNNGSIVVELSDFEYRYKDDLRTIEFNNGLFTMEQFMTFLGIHGKVFHVSQKDALMNVIPNELEKWYDEDSKTITVRPLGFTDRTHWDDENVSTAFLLIKIYNDPGYKIVLSEDRVALEANRVTNDSNSHPIPLDFSDYLEPV